MMLMVLMMTTMIMKLKASAWSAKWRDGGGEWLGGGNGAQQTAFYLAPERTNEGERMEKKIMGLCLRRKCGEKEIIKKSNLLTPINLLLSFYFLAPHEKKIKKFRNKKEKRGEEGWGGGGLEYDIEWKKIK